MNLLIKPNWSTGSLTAKTGRYTLVSFGGGRISYRIATDQVFSVNDRIRIVQIGTEARAIVRSFAGPGIGSLGYLMTVELLSGQLNKTSITSVELIDVVTIYELEGSIDFKLNFRILDIKDLVKSSVFTKDFEIPFTETNNRIFTQVFNINVDDGYNPKIKSDLLITNEGNLIASGYIQIMDIDVYKKVYKCIFYGDNKNLFDDIGDKYIVGNDEPTDDINFDDLVHDVSDNEVIAGWNGERDYIYGLLNDENTLITKTYMQSGVDAWRWKVWLKSKAVFDRIMTKWGYTYTSQFLNGEVFNKHMIMPNSGWAIGQPVIKWSNSTPFVLAGGFNPIILTTEEIDFYGSKYNPATGRFIMPTKGDFRFSSIVNFGEPKTYNMTIFNEPDKLAYQWNVYRKGKKILTKIGPIFYSQKRTAAGPSGPGSTGITTNTPIRYIFAKDTLVFPMLEAGDEVQIGIIVFNSNRPYTATSVNDFPTNPFPDDEADFTLITSSKIGSSPGTLLNKVKQIDFISDIFKQFNLYIQPDKTNPRNFLIEPRDQFYKTGQTIDFLEYDTDSVNISPGNDIFPKNWKFSYKAGDDTDNELFQTKYKDRVFGDNLVDIKGDFLKNTKTVQLEAMPIMYEKVFDNFVIANISGGKKGGQLRYSFYTGKTTFDNGFAAIYKFPVESGPQPTFNYYPLFSNYFDGLGVGDSILFATNNNERDKEGSLYYKYWENEVETLADRNSHILTVDVRMNSNILSRIDFNDIYWFEIKGVGRYYTLLEIQEYDPQYTDMVTMLFLTYIDYRASKPKRSRPNWDMIDVSKPNPVDNVGSNVFEIYDPFKLKPIDDMWGYAINEPVNGPLVRGSGIVFLGDGKYPTIVGDAIIVEPGVDRPFVSGTNILVGSQSTDAFVWGATDVNIDATVVSWGAVGKTHSIGNAFLFNEFNPVLDSKDQTGITQSESGTMVWNETEETLYISKNNTWLPVGGGVNTDYINFFDYSTESVTTFSGTDQWEPLNMTATTGYSQGDLSVDTDGLMTYSGSSPRVFRISGVASGSSGANNEIHFAFFKGAVLWPCSEQSGITGAAGRANSIPFQCLVEMNSGDDLQVYVKNSTGSTSFTLQNVNVIVERI